MNPNEILIAFPNEDYMKIDLETFGKNIKTLEVSKEFDDCIFAWVGKSYIKFEKTGFIQLKYFINERNRINSTTNIQ